MFVLMVGDRYVHSVQHGNGGYHMHLSGSPAAVMNFHSYEDAETFIYQLDEQNEDNLTICYVDQNK